MVAVNRNMKILIVDDSSSMRRIVRKFFKNHDFHNLFEAVNGAKALETIQQDPIDLIVSDLNMPVMDGMALLKAVKQNPDTKAIPFIMLSVEAIQKTMNTAVDLKVDSYIVKPVSEEVFIEEVYRVIEAGNG